MKKYLFREFDNREDWLVWRRDLVGASDISAIMGVSPYSSYEDILQNKLTGESRVASNNFIVEKGHEVEARHRNIAELVLDYDLPSKNLESLEYEGLSCSLDGFDVEENVIWECKLMGAKVFDQCIEEQIPPMKYYFQVQQQLLISGADVCIFWFVDMKENYDCFTVHPDLEAQEQIISKFELFKKELETKGLENGNKR